MRNRESKGFGKASTVQRRQGVSVIMILALISITLGLSYAMLRTQVTETIIHRNVSRTGDAHGAAQAAVSIALQTMNSDQWQGADSSFNGTLSAYESYSIQYQTGDPALQEGDPNYDEFPYRVTITATGHAVDPLDANIRSSHRIRVVVQLGRQHLQPVPDEWEMGRNHTLVQTGNYYIFFYLPFELKGTMLIQGWGLVCNSFPPFEVKSRYMMDLGDMYENGQGDYRPFDSKLKAYRPESSLAYWVADAFGQAVEAIPFETINDVVFPDLDGSPTYQLYPGGKEYTIEIFNGSELRDYYFRPDVLTNPLGVLRMPNEVIVRNNVDIEGTVFCEELELEGSNISLRSPQLPSTSPLKLPAVVTAQDFHVHENCSLAAEGAIVCFEDFTFLRRSTLAPATFKGPIYTYRFTDQGRHNWANVSSDQWYTWLAEFEDQLDDDDITPIPYFPQWLETTQGLSMKSTIKLEYGPSNVVHHWPDWTKPLYDVDPDDGGLRWDIVSWEDLGR